MTHGLRKSERESKDGNKTQKEQREYEPRLLYWSGTEILENLHGGRVVTTTQKVMVIFTIRFIF